MAGAKVWAKRDERALLQGVGIYGLGWFKKKTGDSYARSWENAPEGRSRHSVYSKARRLYGSGGLTRGAYTLAQASDFTGYAKSQLRRAMLALAQKWKRTSAHGSYLIYEEQLDELADWLKNDYWSKKLRLYNCVWCGTDSRPHYMDGLCKCCGDRYIQVLYRSCLPCKRSMLLALIRKWKKVKLEGTNFLNVVERRLAKGQAPSEQLLGRLVQLGQQYHGEN